MRIELSIPLNLTECVTAMGVGNITDEKVIRAISIDSRHIQEGDLFIALAKKESERLRHILEAKRAGAVTVGADKCDVIVGRGQQALLSVARLYKRKLRRLISVIGITGSVGKTTTKEFLSKLLSTSYRVHSTPENYNNDIGLPISILTAPTDTEILILEMGMNHSGEIRELNACAEVDIGIITNIGTSHIGKLGSREAIAKAKLEILEMGAKAIIPYGEKLLGYIDGATSFSFANEYASIFIKTIVESDKGYDLCVRQVGHRDIRAHLGVPGRQNVECLLPAIAACRELQVPSSVIESQVSSISNVNTRQNIENVKNFYILDDSYNASLESMEAAFELLFAVRGYSGKSALLGDVLELGEMSEKIHRTIGCSIGSRMPRSLFLCGKYAEHYAYGARLSGLSADRIHTFGIGDEEECAAMILTLINDDELLLCKGSHASSVSAIKDILKSDRR